MIVLSGLAVGAQCYGLYRPLGPPDLPWFPQQADKVAHLLGFAAPVALILLALAWYSAGDDAAPTPVTTALVIGCFALHAVGSEIIQSRLYTDRTGDPWDVVADGLGIAAGAAVFTASRPTVTRRAKCVRMAA